MSHRENLASMGRGKYGCRSHEVEKKWLNHSGMGKQPQNIVEKLRIVIIVVGNFSRILKEANTSAKTVE